MEYEEPKFNRKKIIISVAVSFLSLILSGALLYQGSKEPVITALDDAVHIQAMYGLTIPFSEITDIQLLDESMRDIGVGKRTNAYRGFGATLKGHFQSDTLGNMLLFVESTSEPTIWIERTGKSNVYISLPSGEQTERLYYDLTAKYAMAHPN